MDEEVRAVMFGSVMFSDVVIMQADSIKIKVIFERINLCSNCRFLSF